MFPDPDTLMTALRQKAAGESNSLGDVWTDAICGDAADMIGNLAEALNELLFEDSDKSEVDRLKTRLKARSALTRATGG